MIYYAEVEVFLYECHSLKDKRSILLKLKNRLRKELNIAVAEIDYQNLWQRAKLAVVTVSDSKVINEKVLQQSLSLIDSFPELERAATNLEVR
ncbi:hypothetical protein SAMN04487944_101143 [Gracilibacillus ureilyticus]|uniref:DUF503 domain-containing protein n=1 Tax=Gracilibacillus ureilyticus TaxID=531814 RepID=A0A1H9L7Q9_9BACI|nr:DUF503 domain-containing protein [Gracilibacillus ureilyticus]SER07522.1 hypothetical protein SAMN04487944_101143 [Gracilibacillus ureilyticus]